MLNAIQSPIGLLLFGFVLTTLAGSIITSRLQAGSWQRQTRVDLFRKRYDEGTQFLDQFSRAIGNRFFYLQRLLWAIPDTKDDQMRQIELDYFKVVAEWNSTYWMFRNKIRLLVGDESANGFLDYRDELRLEAPESLHYHFVKAHRHVLQARRKEVNVDQAQPVVDDLNWVCSAFLETLTTAFLTKATSLQLLAVPKEEQSTLSEAIRERGRTPIPVRLWKSASAAK